MPTEGSVRERLVIVLEHVRLRVPETFSGRIMPRMVAYARSHPELYELYTQRVLEPRRDRLRGLLREGVASGELRADLDIDVATSCFVAPILYTSLVLCSGSPAPEGLSEKVVDLVLNGAALMRPQSGAVGEAAEVGGDRQPVPDRGADEQSEDRGADADRPPSSQPTPRTTTSRQSRTT